ncbi:MAG: DEAD/DEAH box helicase [Patescibacteria group bacterium]
MRRSFSSRRTNSSGGYRGRSNSGRPAFRGSATPRRGGGRSRKPAHRGAYINPAKYVNKIDSARVEDVFTPKHRFEEFGFSDKLVRNLLDKGYANPTPIQDEAILPIKEGRDLIGLANTGTGKTAAFLLPIIHQLQTKPAREAVLIIAPTRELAGQIIDEFRMFTKGLNLSATLIVGGSPMKRQVLALKKQPNVIIGTPGRLKDLANQKKMYLGNIRTFVLDEADHMMDMGFLPDVRFIMDQIPTRRQSLCFTATLPNEVEKLMRDLLSDPVTVSVKTGNTSDNVDQDVLYANNATEKIDQLIELFAKEDFSKILIFGKTKHGVQRLSDDLRKAGLRSEAIHGNKSQAQRQRALDNFKKDRSNILVATDVAARGIDVPSVSHVINFDQPSSYEDYIHRIGRTGRAGKLGKALTFVPIGTKIEPN